MIQEEQLATTGRRAVAIAIDSMVLSLFVLILFYDPLMTLSAHIANAVTPEETQSVYKELRAFNQRTIPYIFVLYILYQGILIWQNGMTLGKYIMKIKVIDTVEGGNLILSKSLMRALFHAFGELFLFYITFLPAYFNPLKQTLHDKLAGSIVIDLRP